MFILCKISRFLYSAGLAWNCLFTPIFGSFGRYYHITPNEFKNDHPWTKACHMSHKPWKSFRGFDLGSCPIKKYSKTNQEKVINRNISPIWGEAPAKRIEMKICLHWRRSRRRNRGRQVQFFFKFRGFWSVMLILVLVLVLKDSLRTKFKSLSLFLQV